LNPHGSRFSHVSRLAFHVSRTSVVAAFLVAPAAIEAQNTNGAYVIDLATALRLVNARNLDVHIARARLKEARANRDQALEQFLPWLSPGAAYRKHEGQIRDVAGRIISADELIYTIAAQHTAPDDLGDAIYQSLASKQLVIASDQHVESRRQERTLAAAQGYFDLGNARALVEVLRESLQISQNYQNQLHEAVAAGIAFRGDELRVQVQTERYQLGLRQALEKQRIASARLAEILHLDSTIELAALENEMVPLH